MKNSAILKIVLLLIPAIVMGYVTYVRKGVSGGGGSYDLTNLYTTVGVGIWSAVYVIVMLAKKAPGQVWYLLAGGFLFGFSVMMLLKMW
ncbi:hypothetical protein [Chitinophaga rhizosphaerae]|uniref:hypothetical protein n=1 Tax=Chitinophaga rhizosphaerae TaxID=1864947 RepID=UPI000F8061AA|nr:hypothetical protein [Chitinophaga rhizosphaerae]